ncbi:MAG: monovalent cation/H+ antiporter complex subunit F [Oscillospiraceae bacterium]
MNELLYFAIFYILCALIVIYRLAKGPSVVDRAVAADCIDVLTDVALVLFAIYSGRGIYLDIALVTALLGFVGTVLISKYLEGTL